MKRQRSTFYLLITILLLIVVLLGFGRTFFLRPFFPQPIHLRMDQLPTYIILHGLSMMAWYIMLVVQSALVNAKNVKLHMKLGWALAALAVLLIAFGIPVMMGFAPRMLELGFLDPENPGAVLFQNMLWTNDLSSMLAFCVLVGVGLIKRNNKAFHRTMLLFGSMAFMAPATFRMLDWMIGELAMPGMVTLFLLFPLSVAIHDWQRYKKLPYHTIMGVSFPKTWTV